MERFLTTTQPVMNPSVNGGVEAWMHASNPLVWGALLLGLAFSSGARAASPLRPPVSYFTNASGVLIYDFDGDGRKDVVQFNPSGLSVSLQRNDGLLQSPKSFPFNIGCSEQIGAAVMGDLDGDGHPDIAVPCWGAISIIPGGAGGFGSPVLTSLGTIVFHTAQVVDWFEDGNYEIAATGTDYFTNVAMPQSYFVLLRLNTDDTVTVLRENTIPIEGVAFADLRGDGVQDILTSQYQANLHVPAGGLAIQRDTGTGFSAPEQYGDPLFMPHPLAIADINGDGRLDVVLSGANNGAAGSAGLGGGVEVLTQNADGTFTQLTTAGAGENPGDIAVADFDGDGLPDIAVGNDGFQTFTVIRQISSGQFAAIGTYLIPDIGLGTVALGVADINSDGKPDVMTGSSSFEQVGEFDVWYNAAGTAYDFDPTVTYTVGPSQPVIGNPVTFNVNISNDGSTTMSDWELTFTVPSLFKIGKVDNRCTFSASTPDSGTPDVYQQLFTCDMTLSPHQKITFTVTATALPIPKNYEPDPDNYEYGGYAELAPFIYAYSTNSSVWASVPANEQAFITVTSVVTAPSGSGSSGGTGSTSGSPPGTSPSSPSKSGGGSMDLISSLILMGLALVRIGSKNKGAEPFDFRERVGSRFGL